MNHDKAGYTVINYLASKKAMMRAFLPLSVIAVIICVSIVAIRRVPHTNHRQPPATPQLITIPYTTGAYGHPIVTVILNNGLSAPFVIDTGSTLSVIDARKLTSSGRRAENPLRYSEAERFPNASVRPQSVMFKTIVMGKLRFRNVPLRILDLPRSVPHVPSGIDGIIGLNLLRDLALAFDSDAHTLRIWCPGGLSSTSVTEHGFTQRGSIHLEDYFGDGMYSTQVRLRETSHALLLDTGSQRTLLPGPPVFQSGKRGTAGLTEYRGLTGNVVLREANVPRLRVGPRIFSDVSVLTGLSGTSPLRPALGFDLISRMKILMDLKGRRVYFSKAVLDSNRAVTNEANRSIR